MVVQDIRCGNAMLESCSWTIIPACGPAHLKALASVEWNWVRQALNHFGERRTRTNTSGRRSSHLLGKANKRINSDPQENELPNDFRIAATNFDAMQIAMSGRCAQVTAFRRSATAEQYAADPLRCRFPVLAAVHREQRVVHEDQGWVQESPAR